MAYPDICTKYCKYWKTKDCPNSDKCLATTDKPYFYPKFEKYYCHSLLEKIKYYFKKRKICKSNGYNCSECLYHGYFWRKDGAFTGTYCRFDNTGQE